MLQWELENYGKERQHHSVFDVIVTSQTRLIRNLLNHLSSYMGLLESKLSLPMPDFSGYHATWILWNKILSLNTIFIAFETEMLRKFSLLYATTKV